MPSLVSPRRILAPIPLLAALLWQRADLAGGRRSSSVIFVVRAAPSVKAKPLFVVLAGTPVELVVSLEGWSKGRVSRDDLTWIEKKHLAEKRNVIVRAERAQVRAAAEDKAALVFEAERDVVLDLLEVQPAGWARVRHRDGQDGFLKATQVWGL